MRKRSLYYLREVRDQIKLKEAKGFVSVELDHHIRGAKNEWSEK